MNSCILIRLPKLREVYRGMVVFVMGKVWQRITKYVWQRAKYWFLSLLNAIVPKRASWVFIFDKRLRKDNVWAIAKYLSETEYSNYNVYYYSKYDSGLPTSITMVSKPWEALWRQICSKYVFYSYDDMPPMRAFHGQVIVYTTHGSPLKTTGYLLSNSPFKKLWRFERNFTHVLSQSDFFEKITNKAFGISGKQSLIVGFPRNDIIFSDTLSLDRLGIDRKMFCKVILWMPTYRPHRKGEVRETLALFPILSVKNIRQFNEFLRMMNTLVIIKPHPNQLECEVLQQTHSHIKVLCNEDLHRQNVELYGLFGQVDALVTDYSSVLFDFLLTLKPIGFAIDDHAQFGKKRGFVVEDPLSLMPGQRIRNIEDYKTFITDLTDGKDKFHDQRVRINDLANKYQDGQSSRRLVEALGIGRVTKQSR